MIVGAFESTFPFRLATSALPPQARTPNGFPMPTPVAPTATPATQRNLKCGYPSKICTNERAWKRDGSLHRFCEEHRARANTNQKRWAQRKARTKAEKSNTTTIKSEEYHVDESLLHAEELPDFDSTLDLLLNDASFWSPTAATTAPPVWESDVAMQQDEDALEAELWAALGLGNVTVAL